MSPEMIVSFARQAVEVTLLLALPMLGLSLLVGLVISVFQATTQIQEMTLTFVPKIIAVLVALVVFMPWLLSTIVDFTVNLLTSIGQIKIIGI
ncbi:MAG: flagellar biosynthesis protein FliQ [Proteobacteria bacterium]|nr:flagellar biosynthesis protein FliQ [Pseudomonadota bacterium]